MHEDERDLLEVLIFDEIEEAVGTWLRAIRTVGKFFRFRAEPVLANSCEGGTPLLALIPRMLLAQSSTPGPPSSCNGPIKFVGTSRCGTCSEHM
jgi:hypothetical protein